MNIVSSSKETVFGDLEVGGYIFMIELTTQKVIPYQIAAIKKLGNNQLDIQYFKVVPLQGIQVKSIITSASDLSKDLPVKGIIVKEKDTVCMTMAVPPLVFGASEKGLKKWMREG